MCGHLKTIETINTIKCEKFIGAIQHARKAIKYLTKGDFVRFGQVLFLFLE